MSGNIKTQAGLAVIAALAVLAGAPQARHAAAQTAAAASEAELPEEAPAGPRVRSFTEEVPPGALQGVRLESLLGREIRTLDDDPGRIIDILVDREGQVRAAVVELGGFLGIGTRKIAIEWTMLRFQSRDKQPRMVLEMTRDQLRLAPEYNPSQPVLVRRTDW
jgi:hypothetical protein